VRRATTPEAKTVVQLLALVEVQYCNTAARPNIEVSSPSDKDTPFRLIVLERLLEASVQMEAIKLPNLSLSPALVEDDA